MCQLTQLILLLPILFTRGQIVDDLLDVDLFHTFLDVNNDVEKRFAKLPPKISRPDNGQIWILDLNDEFDSVLRSPNAAEIKVFNKFMAPAIQRGNNTKGEEIDLAKQKFAKNKDDIVLAKQKLAKNNKEVVGAKQKFAKNKEDIVLAKVKSAKNKEEVVVEKQKFAKNKEKVVAAKKKFAKNTEDIFLAKLKSAKNKKEVVVAKQKFAKNKEEVVAAKQKFAQNKEEVVLVNQKYSKNHNDAMYSKDYLKWITNKLLLNAGIAHPAQYLSNEKNKLSLKLFFNGRHCSIMLVTGHVKYIYFTDIDSEILPRWFYDEHNYIKHDDRGDYIDIPENVMAEFYPKLLEWLEMIFGGL